MHRAMFIDGDNNAASEAIAEWNRRADLAAVQPAQVRDMISRMDAIQACQVGPSDEWSKSTKSGYEQAATDCQRNILRIKPAALEPHPDPRDAVIAQLVEALEYADRMVRLDLIHMTDFDHDDFSQAVVDTGKRIASALAAAKGGAA